MDYDAVAIDRDRDGRQCRHVDTDTEGHRNKVAQGVAERPLLEQAGDGSERDRQETHGDVGDGEVGDEDVGDGLHHRVADDDEYDESVSCDAENEDDRVCDDEGGTQRRAVHEVVRLRNSRIVVHGSVLHRNSDRRRFPMMLNQMLNPSTHSLYTVRFHDMLTTDSIVRADNV